MENKKALGHVLAIFTIFIWGTTFISTKILLQAFQPVEILFFRFVMGYILLWIMNPHRLPIKSWKQELTFAGAGLTGMTLYYLMENIALTYSQASNVGVIVSIAPVFTAITAHIFLKEEGKLRPAFFMGCVIALIGISLISCWWSDNLVILFRTFQKNRKFWLFCSSGNKKNLFLWNTIYDPGIIYI